MLPDIIHPRDLDESRLLDADTYLLDLRPAFQRGLLKGLACAHEFHFPTFPAELYKVPRDKRVIVICQLGLTAVGTALYLLAKGYGRVGVLAGGLLAWKLAHPDLYAKYSGQQPGD